MSLQLQGAKHELGKPSAGFSLVAVEATHKVNPTHALSHAHFPEAHSSIHLPHAARDRPIVIGMLESEMESRCAYICAVAARNDKDRRSGRARNYLDISPFDHPEAAIAANPPEFSVAFSRRFYMDEHLHND